MLPVLAGEDRDPGYVPAGPIASITAGAVLRATRGEVFGSGEHLVSRTAEVASLLERLEGAWGGVADETTLAMLCEAPHPEQAT